MLSNMCSLLGCCSRLSTGWIAANLPGNHPLFSSPCVRRRHMEELASHVDMSILHCGDCGMRATGIPSVVRIAMDLEALTLRQSEMARELRNVMGNDDGQSLSKTVVGQIEQHLAIMSERFVDALVPNSSKLEGSLTSSTTKMEQRLAIAVERLGVVRVNAVVFRDRGYGPRRNRPGRYGPCRNQPRR